MFQTLAVLALQGTLMYFVLEHVIIESTLYLRVIMPIFRIYILQYVVAYVLHLMILPQFANGFNIIKFVNNHPKSFDQPIIAYMLGLT